MNNMREYENKYIEQGYNVIAGTDEAGRGPLVGPVVCACVSSTYGDFYGSSSKVREDSARNLGTSKQNPWS